MKTKENKSLRLLLRADYIWLFIIGVGITSIGTWSLMEEDTSLPKEATLFLGIIAIVIGISIIVIAFYRKKQYERLINKHRL